MKKTAKTLEEMSAIASFFVDKFLKKTKAKKGATVVHLSGDLGAGKTSFTQEVAKYLGVKDKVTSPTFVIMKRYGVKFGIYENMFHLDAYRLKGHEDLLHLGWDKIIEDNKHLVLIEWGEKVAKILPKNSILVSIKTDKNGHRNIEIK